MEFPQYIFVSLRRNIFLLKEILCLKNVREYFANTLNLKDSDSYKMNYKLYKDVVPEYSARQQILYNRGIPVQEQERWLNARWDEINDWRLFDRMEDAVNRVHQAIQRSEQIQIVVDCD